MAAETALPVLDLGPFAADGGSPQPRPSWANGAPSYTRWAAARARARAGRAAWLRLRGPNLWPTAPPALAADAPGGDSSSPDDPILANDGDNSLKVRLRAHPDAAERHHADLLASGAWTS